MVRREEQPWQSRATLFLDNRPALHRGQGIASSLEAAVARRGVDRGPPEPPRLHRPPGHRGRRGPGQRLALPRRRPQHRAPARGPGRRGAAARRRPRHGLARRAGPRRPRPWPCSARLEAADVPVLRRMQHHAGSALAVALDVDAWIAVRPPRHRAARPPLLARQGWRAVALRPARPARRRLAGARPQRRRTGCRPRRRLRAPSPPAVPRR